MTQFNTLNVKLSNLHLNKLKSAIKNVTGVTLNLSSNIISYSNDDINFPHKLLLINTQVSKLRKAFVNHSSANIKLLKTHLHKIEQSGGFLGRPLRPLLKTGLPLIEDVFKPLAKSILLPSGLTRAASATDAAIDKKMFGSGFTTLIIFNEEMEGIMKIVKSLEDSGLSIKDVNETIKMKQSNKKRDFSECY